MQKHTIFQYMEGCEELINLGRGHLIQRSPSPTPFHFLKIKYKYKWRKIINWKKN